MIPLDTQGWKCVAAQAQACTVAYMLLTLNHCPRGYNKMVYLFPKEKVVVKLNYSVTY